MAIRFPLSPKAADDMSRTGRLAWRFEEADRKGKAAILLDAARRLRSALNVTDPDDRYNGAYLLRIVPDLARRLDPESLLKPEEVSGGDPDNVRFDLLDMERFSACVARCADANTLETVIAKRLEEMDGVDNKFSPKIAALADAAHMLSVDETRGNYALRSIILLDPGAAQRGVSSLPGRFRGLDGNLVASGDRAPESYGEPFCVVAERKASQTLLLETSDPEEAEAYISRLEDAWDDPSSLLPGERNHDLAVRRPSSVPVRENGNGRDAPGAISLIHRSEGLVRSFSTSSPGRRFDQPSL